MLILQFLNNTADHLLGASVTALFFLSLFTLSSLFTYTVSPVKHVFMHQDNIRQMDGKTEKWDESNR